MTFVGGQFLDLHKAPSRDGGQALSGVCMQRPEPQDLRADRELRLPHTSLTLPR